MALTSDLPSEDYLSNWRKLKVLKAVGGPKHVEFEPNISKEDYIHRGLKRWKLALHQNIHNVFLKYSSKAKAMWLETLCHEHNSYMSGRYTSKYGK